MLTYNKPKGSIMGYILTGAGFLLLGIIIKMYRNSNCRKKRLEGTGYCITSFLKK